MLLDCWQKFEKIRIKEKLLWRINCTNSLIYKALVHYDPRCYVLYWSSLEVTEAFWICSNEENGSREKRPGVSTAKGGLVTWWKTYRKQMVCDSTCRSVCAMGDLAEEWFTCSFWNNLITKIDLKYTCRPESQRSISYDLHETLPCRSATCETP